MKKKVVVAVLIAILVPVLALAGYFSNLYAYGVWRNEVTITVETPEGLKTGSAIRQGSNFGIAKLIEQPAYYQGEAVVVDLGKRGVLYALRVGSPRRLESNTSTVPEIRQANRLPYGVKTTMIERDYPRMVAFKDPKDAKSVVLVKGWQYDPKEDKYYYEDNIEEFFGKGVRIKEVTAERTKKPLSKKIGPYLPDNYEEIRSPEGWNSLSKEEQQRMDRLIVLIRE